MKTILAIVVTSCFIAMGMAQSQDCTGRANELSTCISRMETGGDIDDFCNTCANNLIRLYRDCDQGDQADVIQQRK